MENLSFILITLEIVHFMLHSFLYESYSFIKSYFLNKEKEYNFHFIYHFSIKHLSSQNIT